MQWIRFIEGDQGDRLVVDKLLADVLFSSAVYLVFQTSQHTLPRVKHFVKLRVSDVRTILNSVGQTVFFQYTFANGMCVRIQQQCGVNRFCSVNFCELDARTIPDYTGAHSGSPQLIITV